MDRERFEAIVAAYGADARRWPQTERASALAFSQSDGAAAQLLGEARALDAAMDADAGDAGPSDLLVARIMRAAPKPARSIIRPQWRPAAALAACAVFGLAVGFGGGALVAPAQDESDAIIAAAFTSPSPELDWYGEEG
ncbi:MAG: hypothetical protein AB7J28_13150 [Hyphomonadaceae bacterium]